MLFSFFNKKAKSKLGIDISSSAIKVLELSFHQGVYQVENYAIEALPPGLVVEKNITDTEGLANVIQRAVKKSGSTLENAAVAVASSSVITRIIQQDASLSEDEIEIQIRLEAEQYIPYPIDEVKIDFVVRGASEDQSDRVDVLLVACRSELVDLRSDALIIAGLVPQVIDVESYAVERVVDLMASSLSGGINQMIALVDVGANTTTLYILLEGSVIYSIEQTFGGRQLTDEIQRRYGLSFEESGFAKKRGGLPEDYDSEVLAPFKDALVQQIIRSLQFFFSSSQYNHVDSILLAGGSSAIPGLPEMVQDKVGAITQLVDPFADMTIEFSVNAERLREDASALMIACGLALRSFQ